MHDAQCTMHDVEIVHRASCTSHGGSSEHGVLEHVGMVGAPRRPTGPRAARGRPAAHRRPVDFGPVKTSQIMPDVLENIMITLKTHHSVEKRNGAFQKQLAKTRFSFQKQKTQQNM